MDSQRAGYSVGIIYKIVKFFIFFHKYKGCKNPHFPIVDQIIEMKNYLIILNN